MKGHNICFHREIRKIISELSSLLLPIWSSVFSIKESKCLKKSDDPEQFNPISEYPLILKDKHHIIYTMNDISGDILQPPHGTTQAAEK